MSGIYLQLSAGAPKRSVQHGSMVKVYAAQVLCLHLATGEVLDARAGAGPLNAIIGDAQVTLAAHAHNNG